MPLYSNEGEIFELGKVYRVWPLAGKYPEVHVKEP